MAHTYMEQRAALVRAITRLRSLVNTPKSLFTPAQQDWWANELREAQRKLNAWDSRFGPRVEG